jgi:hypothetical protein
MKLFFSLFFQFANFDVKIDLIIQRREEAWTRLCTRSFWLKTVEVMMVRDLLTMNFIPEY